MNQGQDNSAITLRGSLSHKSQTNLLVARQPILNIDQSSYGYELLFRGDWDQVDTGSTATVQVLDESLHVIGLHTLLGGGIGFINFTRELILEGAYELLPADSVVIELLEDIVVDNDLVIACKAMKKKGYRIALDDYILDHTYGPLVELADILKIDFVITNSKERLEIRNQYPDSKPQFLAEKVETYTEYDEAKSLGCLFVQGFFFCKPESISSTTIPANKQSYMQLLTEVNCGIVDFDRVEQILKREVSLALRLLKYLNSAFVGLGSKVDSIKQALVLLGEKPLRKWASLVAMTALGEDKAPELIRTTLIRARFCELLGSHANLHGKELDLFLTGLLSTVDAFLDQALDEILIDMPLSKDIKAALFGGDTPIGHVLMMMVACEHGNVTDITVYMQKLNVSHAQVSNAYLDALEWAQQITDHA